MSSSTTTRRFWASYRTLNPLRTFAEMLAQRTQGGQLRVLDIGCGFDTPTLAKLPGFRIGIDLEPVEKFVPSAGVRVLRASGQQLPFAEASFDIACCRSVLEHVDNPKEMFAEVRRVLKPGGTFVFVTPNRWDYVSIVSTLVPDRFHPWIVHALTGRAEEKTFPTLYRANTVGDLRQLAAESGLRVESLELCRQHPHYLQRSLVLYSLGVAFEQVVQRPFAGLRPWILGVMTRA